MSDDIEVVLEEAIEKVLTLVSLSPKGPRRVAFRTALSTLQHQRQTPSQLSLEPGPRPVVASRTEQLEFARNIQRMAVSKRPVTKRGPFSARPPASELPDESVYEALDTRDIFKVVDQKWRWAGFLTR